RVRGQPLHGPRQDSRGGKPGGDRGVRARPGARTTPGSGRAALGQGGVVLRPLSRLQRTLLGGRMKGRRLPGCSCRAPLALAVSLLVVVLPAPASEAETGSLARDRPDPAGRRSYAAPTSALGHTVRSGDTLWSIARRYGVGVDALTRANGLRSNQRLQVGQHLVIPGSALEDGPQEP